MDPIVHKRFLDYREKHIYFGGKSAMLNAADFEAADAEHRLLDAMGEGGRDDEEEARFAELAKILYHD